MSKMIRCRHAHQHLQEGGSLPVLLSDCGNFVELCDCCCHELLDDVMSSLPIGQWEQVVKKYVQPEGMR